MSLSSQDEVFLHALKKNPIQRDQQDLEIIFSRLHRFEALCNLREQKLRSLAAQVRYEQHSANEILYGKDDPCTCWFILLSGSIFIQGSMFLRNTSFGKRIPGMKLRGTQCLVLEKSEMIVIEYPDDQTAMIIGNQQNSETVNPGSPLKVPAPNAIIEDECNNFEASPNRPSRARRIKLAHDQGLMPQAESLATYRQSWDSSQGSEFVSQENLKVDDMEEGESIDDIEEQDDSISLHSSSSVIKDLVIDALKKDLSERNEDDNDTLFEFTRSLQAFSNMTESTRRELCKFMVFAQADKADTILLQDNELLDSWSVIINGSVQVVYPDSEEEKILGMGDSFGVEPHLGQQRHKGTMYTMVDECQFVCIAQAHYFEVLAQGKENMDFIYSDDGTLEMVKEKREADGGRTSNIVIRGIPTSLHLHLLEENATDNTYAEDFLLTYRAFWNEPRKICELLLDWFGEDKYKPKITRVILLWVNNHFNDFEEDVYMMELLERFEEKLRLSSKSGECRLFNIACSTKAKSRVVKITRSSVLQDLGISLMGGIHGYPIYVSNVSQNSIAMEKGVKRGDQLLNVNGQNFEKLEKDKAQTILQKNTDLTLTVKTNLFAFKAMMSEMRNPGAFLKSKSNNEVPVSQSSTLQVPKISKFSTFTSETDLYDGKGKKDSPEDVIKVFKADQTFRFVFVNHDTTAEEAIKSACKEFGIAGDNYKNFSLCRVSVQNETFVKQSKLPEKWSNLSNIPLNARYYLKNDMESEQLMPDENIPDLLKEANYSFLDLDCFEVALQLTIQDYELFRTVEQTDFIDDLFKLNDDRLKCFRDFENLVNRELFWVVSTICMEPNSLRRSKMIKHFTKIAHHCKSLKNLNSTFAIISGLGYRAVSRMRSSWEKVPMKIQRTFEDLQALMDPSRNMSKYRTLLSDCSSQPPVIPYIPVIKKDLTFIHLGNDTKVDGLVNFEKMRMMGREVRNVCRLCSAESSQIFASSSTANSDADRSNIYQTITRKNRRASFGNARKMYEEAVNARRVKQYMSHLVIENDEEKLLEMSKQVEPVAVSSTHLKRKTEKTDSPSRSSKTLPHGASLSKAHSQSRNNSEPHIYAPTGMTTQAARKKAPSSSLPKFGTSSPQAIKKLLALSEESDGGPHIGVKVNSREGRAESMGSQDLSSSHSSPSMQSRHEMLISKGSMSSSDSMHSLAYENNNHSNNKAMHRRRDNDSALPASHPHRSSQQGDYSSSSQSHGSHFRKSDQGKFSQVPHNVHRKTSNRSYAEKQNIKGSRESLNSRTSLDDQVDGKKRHHRKRDSELSRSGMYSSSSSIDSTQKSQTSETTDEDTKQAFLYGSRGVRDAPMTPEKHPSRNTAKEITSPYHQSRMKARLFDIEQHQQKKVPAYQDVHGYYEHMKTQWNPYLQSPVEHFHPQMSRRNTTGHLSAENHQRSRTGDVIEQQGKYPYYRKNSAPIIHEEQLEKNPTFYYPGHGVDPAHYQYLYSGKRMEYADHEGVSPHAIKSPNFQSFRNKSEDGVDYTQNFVNDGQRQAFPNRMKKELPHISECAEGTPRNFTRAASSQNQRPYTSPISAYSTSHSVPNTPSADSQYLFLDRGNQRYDLHQNVSDYHRHFMPSPLANHRPYLSRPHNLPLQQSNASGMRQYSLGENEHMKFMSHTPTTPTRNDRVMLNMGYSNPIEPQIPMTPTFYNPHSVGYYNNNNNEFTSTSSPQKQSLKPASTSRRKSQEWSVTDLDKENQQFAMQVWTSRSTSSTNHTGHYQRQSRDGGGLQQLAEDLETINHRLGATDISPSPSSKSNEAARDAEVNGTSKCNEQNQSQSFEGMAEKKRTPPTYNEALGHVSELPSYEDLEAVKDNRELSSHV